MPVDQDPAGLVRHRIDDVAMLEVDGETGVDPALDGRPLALLAAARLQAVAGRGLKGRVAERRLADRVEIRLQDYREVPERGTFDAVSSIEMGEHVGERNYPTYASVLHRSVRPGGRVLVQQMSRTGRWPGGGPFIESFIAPDMHMRPVGETVAPAATPKDVIAKLSAEMTKVIQSAG